MPPRLAVALGALLTVLPGASFAQTTRPSSSGGTTAVITGQGLVSRAPDMATLNASIQSNDGVAANATAKSNATYAALQTALAALHVDPADIKTTYYNMTFNPRPSFTPVPLSASPATTIVQQYPYPYPGARYGYLVNRQLSITVSRAGDVGAVIDAAVKAGVTNVTGVSYGLRDRRSASDAALALALEDAAAQAKVVAAVSHLRLGAIKNIQVGPSYGGGPIPMPMRAISANGLAGVPTDVTPSTVDVRATATVTYVLTP